MRGLSEGSQGSTTLVRCMRSKQVVVRKAAKYDHTDEYFADVFPSDERSPEVRNYRQHPNINPLLSYEHYEDLRKIHATMIHQYCNGGDLADFVLSFKEIGAHVPETLIWRFTHQIYSALHYLHRECKPAVVHEDIFRGNVLVDWPEDVTKLPNAYLSDFGTSLVHDVDLSAIQENKADNHAISRISDTATALAIHDCQISFAQDMDDLSKLVMFMMTGDKEDLRCNQPHNEALVATVYSADIWNAAVRIFDHSCALDQYINADDQPFRNLIAQRAAESASEVVDFTLVRPEITPDIKTATPLLFESVEAVMSLLPRPPGPWEIVRVDDQSLEIVGKVDIGFQMCANRVYYTDAHGLNVRTGGKTVEHSAVIGQEEGVDGVAGQSRGEDTEMVDVGVGE